MSALSCQRVLARLRDADPKRRLVISPILDPLRQLPAAQVGVDVRLGRGFSIPRPWAQQVAEALEPPEATEPTLETTALEFGQALVIHPHQFVLARTLEIVRLPSDLLAYVIGRSSWGRRGLIIATAVVVHPGFAGPITLELKNLGEVPIVLYPFDRIAQLVFHEVGVDKSAAEGASQFASTYTPVLGSVRDPDTELRIRAFREMRSKGSKGGSSGPPLPEHPAAKK